MKHSVILKVFLLSVLTIFTFHLTQSDTAVIHCPDIAYLGTSAQITCSTPGNFTNTIYYCPCGVAPQCQVSGCTKVSGYNACIINQTQTEITIISVQPKHAGNWSCTDGGDVGTRFCHLVVAKIPSVNITSDVDADSVNLGDRISLTVDIQDYHCSDAYSLTLQIGSATYTCETGRNATVENLTQTVPINVTQEHFGGVKLVFVCGNHQWNITPEGVNELQQNRTNVPTTLSVGAPTTAIPSKGVSALLIVAAGVTSAVVVILIITIACCCCCCRKKVNPAEPRQSSLPSESNTAYSEAGISFQDVCKSNGMNGSSESCATQCSVMTLRDTKDLHDSMGNGGSIYDRLYMN
ncbi:uncharacterized protein LOC124127096 [Haliotis rufescens]|uniref:uncharacterized protein LOC124127096 n=1 Tax=Haliotis rufescens TaxID=6454 RepID=UPI00201F506D|nr:uncharacterized protein LOC124127096 [Haliotis rufescens]